MRNENKIKEIGIALREMRAKRNYSQQMVADRMGVSRAAISLWEIGKNEIPATDLLKYIDVCNGDIQELFDRVNKIK